MCLESFIDRLLLTKICVNCLDVAFYLNINIDALLSTVMPFSLCQSVTLGTGFDFILVYW